MAINKLTMPQVIQLTKWIDENKKIIYGMTVADASNLIHTKLDIKVSPSRLRVTCQELGIPLKNARKSKKANDITKILKVLEGVCTLLDYNEGLALLKKEKPECQ